MKHRLESLNPLLAELSDNQLRWIEEIAQQFTCEHSFVRNRESDIVNDCLLTEIGDALRLHHCFSKEAFTKDKFEYLMERSANHCGIPAALAKRGNPGHDLTLGGEKYSLKSQANKEIRRTYVHISKFMELGKGQWGDDVNDLIGLREQFFEHMGSYDRILVLRRLSWEPDWEYELVEVPKKLLELSVDGTFSMQFLSTQYPKPGYCRVTDDAGIELFNLYFDGGTERKLQIKNIRIANLFIHAQWKFPANTLTTESETSATDGLF